MRNVLSSSKKCVDDDDDYRLRRFKRLTENRDD